jgi:hypothetical protein
MYDVGEPPMSATILAELHDRGILPAAQQADLLNLTREHVRRYQHDVELRYSQLRTLVRRSARREVREAFAADLFAGTGATVLWLDPDADGDGDIDTDDATRSGIAGVKLLAEWLERMNAAVADRSVSDDELRELEGIFSHAMQRGMAAMQAIRFVAEQKHRRRKARPLTTLDAPGGSR